MEQQPQATGSQSGDHVVEIQLVEPVSVAGDAGSREGDGADCHIVNLEHVHDTDTNCSVVCTDPSEWAAIERCGHRVVCPGRMRFFYRNKRCCICRRYETVKRACKVILQPCNVLCSMFWFIDFIGMGAMVGWGVADKRSRSTQVRVYAVSISIAILLRDLVWATSKHDVYMPQFYSVMHWSSLLQRGKEVLNVADHLFPKQKIRGARPLSRMQISTMAIKSNLMVVAGGFRGELICKYVDQRGVSGYIGALDSSDLIVFYS